MFQQFDARDKQVRGPKGFTAHRGKGIYVNANDKAIENTPIPVAPTPYAGDKQGPLASLSSHPHMSPSFSIHPHHSAPYSSSHPITIQQLKPLRNYLRPLIK